MDKEISGEMSFAGALKLSSSGSCVEIGSPQDEAISSYSYENPFNSVEMARVTSSCSIQCFNCKRLTSKLSKVYDDMRKLNLQNEILLAQQLVVKPCADVYASTSENSFSEKSQSEIFPVFELVDEMEMESAPSVKATSEESALINLTFSINVNFVPENGNLDICDASKSKDEKCDGGSIRSNPEENAGNPNSAAAPQLQAMITIRMKMMDELLKAPTIITCIEKSENGRGPSKWLIELESPKSAEASAREDPECDSHGVAAKMKEKMHKEVTHLLQTIRDFFDQQMKASRSNWQPSDAPDLSQTGAIPKKGSTKGRSKSHELSTSSGKSSSSKSCTSGSALELQLSDLSCSVCLMLFPHEFKKKEKAEHRKCHLWPRYEVC